MIHENQVGFIKGRFIGENTRQLYDNMHHLQLEERNSKGPLLLVDFEKAFDSISRKFIDNVLSFLNFGIIFKNYIKCKNNDFKLCVTIQHGFFSSFLNIGRGCRHPISPYIFILCMEILGTCILIRHCNDIKVIKISNIELIIRSFNMLTILDGTDNSLRVALSLLNQFSQYSGLKHNIEKTRCMWLGSKRHSKDTLCEDLSLLWSDEQLKFLRIIFSVDLQQIPELNYKYKIDNIQKLIGQWSKQLISPLGKITCSYKINIDIHNNTFVHIFTKPKRGNTPKT